MKSQIASAILGVVFTLLGTMFYDDYVRPKLWFVISEVASFGNGIDHHKFTVTVYNSGIRPAEDITCRISVDAGKITRATTVVNGESKSISPDFPNAVFDKISYLNQGRIAKFEIEAEGRSVGGLFVLVMGKGVQAVDKTPVPGKNQDTHYSLVMLIFCAAIAIIILVEQNNRNARIS